MRLFILLLVLAGSAQADQVTFAIESMPYKELAVKCAKWPTAIACTTDAVYVQGKPKRTVIMIGVEYLTWKQLGKLCKSTSCYKDGTLYTSSKYSPQDKGRMGELGDILNTAFNLGLGFNRCTDAGHEFYTHILGNGTDARKGTRHF